MKNGGFLMVSIWLYFVVCWMVNVYKLTQCDFASPYKEEVIHAVGLIGPVAGVTAWL